MVDKNKIIDILKQCYDPEIPVDLWSLGLIYDIKINESVNDKSNIKIIMTLTTPGCSMGSYMAEDIKTKVSGLDAVNDVKVDVTFEPPWKPEMMHDSAREKLGFGENKEPTPNPERDWE